MESIDKTMKHLEIDFEDDLKMWKKEYNKIADERHNLYLLSNKILKK